MLIRQFNGKLEAELSPILNSSGDFLQIPNGDLIPVNSCIVCTHQMRAPSRWEAMPRVSFGERL